MSDCRSDCSCSSMKHTYEECSGCSCMNDLADQVEFNELVTRLQAPADIGADLAKFMEPRIELCECPRCGSAEFAIETHSYELGEPDKWVVCRNCDYNMGEVL